MGVSGVLRELLTLCRQRRRPSVKAAITFLLMHIQALVDHIEKLTCYHPLPVRLVISLLVPLPHDAGCRTAWRCHTYWWCRCQF